MNILFVLPVGFNPSFGGVERVTNLLAKELNRRNNKVFFLCTKTGLNNQNAAVDCLCLSRYANTKFSEQSIKEYNTILKDNKIDIIVNQIPLCEDGLSILDHTPSSVKIVSVYHSKPFGNYLAKLFIWEKKGFVGKVICLYYKYKIQQTKRIFRTIIAKSDCLCFLAGSFVKEMIFYLGLKDCKKLYAINNPNMFELRNRPIDFFTKENVILFVGRLGSFSKNTMDFIKVWEIVSKNNPSWRAEIIGDDVGCQKEYDYVKRNKIDRCEFVGHTHNVSEYYDKGSVICVTSRFEGWPMVLMEAMNKGCVPIAYKTFSSIHDIVSDGDNGILVEPYDIETMAQSIQYLIDNPQKRHEMAESAIDSLWKFNISSIVDEWEKLFTNLHAHGSFSCK